MPWRSNLKLSNFSSVFVVLRCRPVLVMFVWRKDQIDLKKLMGLKLWHPEWDLCDYLVRTQNNIKECMCLLIFGGSRRVVREWGEMKSPKMGRDSS
jgi:hypothetical protein